MSAKTEIERRLRVNEYKRISRSIHNKSFDTLQESEYLDILKIADIYGSKYKRFYQLKEGVDIRTFTSNLTPTNSYSPSFSNHNDTKTINIAKTDDSFTISIEFYTIEDVWKEEPYQGSIHRVKKQESFRRTMIIEKNSSSNYVILSIDPIGEGSAVYKKIDTIIKNINTHLKLDFNDFFDMMDISKTIFTLVDKGFLIPQGVSAIDEATKRVKSVQSRVSKDNIKDEEVYKSCINSDLKTENIKMRFEKESLELFEKTLVKISTKADKDKTDELTTEIISVLQK